MSTIRRQVECSRLRTVPQAETPAMFMTTSMDPEASATRAARSRTASWSEMSAGSASTTVPPAAVMSAAAAASASTCTSVRCSRAPWRAASSAVARPMPLAAPVMNTFGAVEVACRLPNMAGV